MEYKSITVYAVLFILMIVVLFLLVHFERNTTTVEIKEPGPNTAAVNVRSQGSDHMTVYINWDGFAWYYYKLANSGKPSGTPILNSLAEHGVLFTDACTGVPSITNPMQTSLLTGAWPSITGNCYQYFDRSSGKIIKTGRVNRAENLAEAVTRQGYRAVSIHQFMLEHRGTAVGDVENPYIQLGNGADYARRFDEAIRYVKSLKQDNLPAFLAVYMDDLDGIGHNGWYTYGVPPVKTERERLESISKRLWQMDAKMGELIQACKDANIYEKISFLLTSDHGMTRYGIQDGKEDGFGYSKLPELINELQNLGYHVEVLPEGKSPRNDTDIVLASTGLQVQLFFTGSYDETAADRITAALSEKEYIGVIMNKVELQQRGAAVEFADMLISPEPPYCFQNDKKLHRAGGQHDSLDESSQHVFALMWGNGVKQGFTCNERVYIIDFAKTISALIGIDSPKNATGRLLDEALE